MIENKNLQEKMLLELQEKSIFNKAQQYALEYIDKVFERNVFPSEQAILDLAAFDEPMPVRTGSANQIIEQLSNYGSPATVATLGGRYFGFVTGSVVPVGLAAKSLSTFWDQAAAMNVLSPVCSKLEAVVEQWLVELFNLSKNTCAGFVSGTSSANLCGLAAARYRILNRLGWDINLKGLYNAPKIRIVTGRQAHSTVLKAIGILGLGQESVEWVDVDDQGRIITDNLPVLDDGTLVILQAGNVNSGSFDAFLSICEQAKKSNSWVHIDGAFGLWAAAVKELNHLTKGMEGASSWAVDGHKTLNTPYDCGIVLCEDKEALTAALHMSGSYIMQSPERDGMFYTPEMSRRARIIELWAIMKYLGKEGISQMVFGMHERAKQFADEIRKIKGFYVDNDIVFNQVLVRCDTDSITEKVLKQVQDMRECWAGSSAWHGKKVIRVSICSWATTAEEISRSVRSFEKALNMVRGG